MSFIVTHSGRKFDFDNIESNEIAIEDIAWALSRICRFTGHVDVAHYSVAEHSLIMSYILDGSEQEKLIALMHDAQEAYLGDMSSPLKQYFPKYKKLEDRVQRHIFASLGISDIDISLIKKLDYQMCITEAKCLGLWNKYWEEIKPISAPLFVKMVPSPIEYAYRFFLSRYEYLKFKIENG